MIDTRKNNSEVYFGRKENPMPVWENRMICDKMIDFEEELKKFAPSMEISEAEEAVLSRDITDAADVIERILQEKKEL